MILKLNFRLIPFDCFIIQVCGLSSQVVLNPQLHRIDYQFSFSIFHHKNHVKTHRRMIIHQIQFAFLTIFTSHTFIRLDRLLFGNQRVLHNIALFNFSTNVDFFSSFNLMKNFHRNKIEKYSRKAKGRKMNIAALRCKIRSGKGKNDFPIELFLGFTSYV